MAYDRIFRPTAAPSEDVAEANAPAVLRLQLMAGNAQMTRALEPEVAKLKGEDNYFGERVAIGPELVDLVSETTAPPLTTTSVTGLASDFTGQAFVKGAGDANAVDPNDIRQGQLGDCYLCAAMMAVARARPGLVQSMITKLDNGSYNVTLHIKDGRWDRNSTQVVTVTPDFPVTGRGEAAYVKPGDSDEGGPELWGMLIEKAYAQARGSYSAIRSGNSGTAAAMIVGGASKEYKVADTSAAEIGKIVDDALKRRLPVTANTMGTEKSKIDADTWQASGVVGHHSYAVKSVDVAAGTMSLQNPWGHDDLDNIAINGPFRKFFVSFDVVTP
ncbi:C2 family cysteine protease [Kibdelosporangium lantanae]|uniref:C2 family cysteine protease n=1 Tax=Kibdelosporangium lantanae TaxID=1497396 RepID=A0ABW3M4W1_9PSEU